MRLLAAVVLALCCAATAHAHGLPHALKVADRTWGSPCTPEVRTERMWSLGRAYLRPPEMQGTQDYCVMWLRDGWWKWSWKTLCTVVVHEVGHLAGREHSSNRFDVMYPNYVRPFSGCSARKGRRTRNGFTSQPRDRGR